MMVWHVSAMDEQRLANGGTRLFAFKAVFESKEAALVTVHLHMCRHNAGADAATLLRYYHVVAVDTSVFIDWEKAFPVFERQPIKKVRIYK